MDNPLSLDNSSTLRNRFNTSSKDDKENKSDNEFEFSAPSLIVADDSDVEENDQCDKGEHGVENESVNLIDLSTNLNADIAKKSKHSSFTTNGDHTKQRSGLSKHSAKLQFGADNNFRFNFQMPREIKTKDKVDEASENFLDTVHTPTKRLQAESTDNKHKKARLDKNSCQPNWALITIVSFLITLLIALVKICLVLYRNEYLI